MSNTVKHTPAPWTAHMNSSYWQIDADDFGQIGDLCASSAAGPEYGCSLELGEANAKHIVKCVNAHDALVTALMLHDAAARELHGAKYLGTDTQRRTQEALKLAGAA